MIDTAMMNSPVPAAPNIRFADDCSPTSIAAFIAAQIAGEGAHMLAVPGGSTPGPILEKLAQMPLGWRDISVYLTDDRDVPPDHPASNMGLIRTKLGKTGAQIISYQSGDTPPYFDLVWLGMGADGHIASLFPNVNPQPDAPSVIQRITPDPLPPEAPFDRLSMTLPSLIHTRQIMLVIKGRDKKEVIDAAIAGEHDLPIARLLKAATMPITIFWSE